MPPLSMYYLYFRSTLRFLITYFSKVVTQKQTFVRKNVEQRKTNIVVLTMLALNQIVYLVIFSM